MKSTNIANDRYDHFQQDIQVDNISIHGSHGLDEVDSLESFEMISGLLVWILWEISKRRKTKTPSNHWLTKKGWHFVEIHPVYVNPHRVTGWWFQVSTHLKNIVKLDHSPR